MSLHQINRALTADVSQYVASSGDNIALIDAAHAILIQFQEQSFSMRRGDSVVIRDKFDGFYVQSAETQDIQLVVGFGDFQLSPLVGSLTISGDVTVVNAEANPVPMSLINPPSAPGNVLALNGNANPLPVVNRNVGGQPVPLLTGLTKGVTETDPLFVSVTKGGSGWDYGAPIIVTEISSPFADDDTLLTFSNGGIIWDIDIYFGLNNLVTGRFRALFSDNNAQNTNQVQLYNYFSSRTDDVYNTSKTLMPIRFDGNKKLRFDGTAVSGTAYKMQVIHTGGVTTDLTKRNRDTTIRKPRKPWWKF